MNQEQSTYKKVIPTFVKVLAVIFLCEALVMAILHVLALRGIWGIAVDPILLAVLSTPLLYRFIVRPISDALEQRRRAEEQLKASNQQLKASEQQLRATNQQLRASEQQLRAANQQIRADEQQLRAANQQLKADEQQLRAANQQLKADEQQLKAANQQLKASEQQLRASEEKSRALAKFPDENPSPVLRVTKDGIAIYANEAGQDLLGAWETEVGRHLPDDWCKFTADVFNSGSDKDTEFECGGRVLTLTFAFVADAEYVNIYGLDITERKRAEEALQKAHDELEERVEERTVELAKANEQLKTEMEEHKRTEQREQEHREALAHASRVSTIGEMAAGLAHELNQPLCAIASYAKGSLQMMRSGSWDNEELLGAMEDVGSQAERAGEIIRRISKLVRKQKSHRSSVNINDIICEAVSLVEAEAELKGITIRRVEPSEKIPGFLADPIQIEQVVLNLLRNGLEAIGDMPEDKGQITIEVSTDEEGAVGVAISDTGKGLPAEIMDKVFEPFFTTKTEGLGIGLSISRSIIEAHEGRLWAVHNPAGGATFQFTLPATGNRYD